jgi:hypothetical protein
MTTAATNLPTDIPSDIPTEIPGPLASDAPVVSADDGRHLTGLGDATTVPTHTFKKAQLLLAKTVGLNDIAAISGPPGCGKTYAVDHFIHHHPVMTGREWHWLEMPPKPTTKEVTQRLMRGLDLPLPRGVTEYELTEDLVPRLRGSGRVVVIDEAQNLKADGLQQLRYLHDRCEWSWTLILVGSTVDRALSGAAELSSRVSAWVRFGPMADTPLLTALRAWHPVLAQMPPELLLRIDEVHARGNWRYWAQFLRALLDLLARKPAGTVPDATLVSAALAAVSRTS